MDPFGPTGFLNDALVELDALRYQPFPHKALEGGHVGGLEVSGISTGVCAGFLATYSFIQRRAPVSGRYGDGLAIRGPERLQDALSQYGKMFHHLE